MTHVYLRRIAIFIMASGLSLSALLIATGSFAFAQTTPAGSTLPPGCLPGAMFSTTTGAPCSSATTPTTCVNLTQNLYWGSLDSTTGGQVTLLQQYLVSNGYLTMPDPSAYGTFGRLTIVAVSNFQIATGITPSTGFVGPITRAVIRQLTCGSSSPSPVSPLTITPDLSNPVAASQYVNGVSGIQGLPMLAFDASIASGTVNISSVSAIINPVSSGGTLPTALYLYDGSTLISSVSVDPLGHPVLFSNLTDTLSAGTPKIFTIKADFPANTVSGTVVSVSLGGITFTTAGGQSSTITPPVTGGNQSLYSASSNLTLLSSSIGAAVINPSGNTVFQSVTFNLKVHPQPGQETQPVPSNFSVYVGTSNGSGGLYIPVASTTVSNVQSPGGYLAPGTALPANSDSTFTLTVTLSPLTTSQLTSGTYTAYIDGASMVVNNINGNPVPQTYTGAALANFYSPSFTISSSNPGTPQPSITVSYPSGGQTFNPGQQVEISYLTANFPRPINIEVQLDKGATYPYGPYNPVSGQTLSYSSATGGYLYTLPSNLPAGNDYSFFISSDYPTTETSAGNSGHSNNFTIASSATSTQPITITSVQYSPVSPQVNNLITTTVTVANNSSMNQTTPFEVGVEGTVVTVPSLAAYTSTTVTIPNAFSFSTPGTQTLTTAIIYPIAGSPGEGNTGNTFTNTLTFTSATPSPSTPPLLQSVSSVKNQGGQNYSIPMPLTGAVGVEDRQGGPTQLMLVFSEPITTNPKGTTFSVNLSSGTVTSTSVVGSALIINLSGVSDKQTLTVNVNNLADAATSAATGNYSFNVGVLLGDVNGNGVVNGDDFTMLNSQFGKATTANNFTSDLNEDGVISGNDSVILSQNMGHVLQSTTALNTVSPASQTASVLQALQNLFKELGGSY